VLNSSFLQACSRNVTSVRRSLIIRNVDVVPLMEFPVSASALHRWWK